MPRDPSGIRSSWRRCDVLFSFGKTCRHAASFLSASRVEFPCWRSVVVAPVEGDVDSPPELSIQLLGPLCVLRGGEPVPLPASRKLRALVAYLAMSTRPQSREQLCELLWPLPD